MASRRDKTVADATSKLGRTIAGALRSWAKEVGADDMASEVMDRVREGFDVVRDHAAAGKPRTKTRWTTKKAKSTTKQAAKKVRSAAKRKTTRTTSPKRTTASTRGPARETS